MVDNADIILEIWADVDKVYADMERIGWKYYLPPFINFIEGGRQSWIRTLAIPRKS